MVSSLHLNLVRLQVTGFLVRRDQIGGRTNNVIINIIKIFKSFLCEF